MIPFGVPRSVLDGGFESQDTSDVWAACAFEAAVTAIGPDLALAPAPTSQQLFSVNGLSSDLKGLERGFEQEFIHRIHSSFAWMRVQSDSFLSEISIVHSAGRTAGADRELAGLAVDVSNIDIHPKQVTEGEMAWNQIRCSIASRLFGGYSPYASPRLPPYASSAASSSKMVAALFKLSTPKTTSPRVEPGSSPQ
jgi:hypothetical protein